MIANYHTHTKRCQHAWGEDKEFIESAIAGGIKTLGFSDHCPWIFGGDYVSGTRMSPSQLDDYFTAMDKLKSEYKDDIKLYIGFEAEYIPELMEAQNKLLEDYPVEYMILGEHFLESEQYGQFTGFETTDEKRLKRYVDLVIEAMETGKYAYTAHPDLLNFIGSDDVYNAQYRRLCEYFLKKDIPLEINMLGVNDGRHYTSERFLRIASNVGNKVIIGVDAHTPDMLCSSEGREKCVRLAEKFGLEIVDTLHGLE